MAEGNLYSREPLLFLFLVFAEKIYSQGGGSESVKAVGTGKFKDTEGDRTSKADISSGVPRVLRRSAQKGV